MVQWAAQQALRLLYLGYLLHVDDVAFVYLDEVGRIVQDDVGRCLVSQHPCLSVAADHLPQLAVALEAEEGVILKILKSELPSPFKIQVKGLNIFLIKNIGRATESASFSVF